MSISCSEQAKMRAGYSRINLSGELQYKSFVPAPLPPNPPLEIDEELCVKLSEANRLIGILEGKSSLIADISLFVAMYVRKEALMSSQIEGTQATLEDVLNPSIDENADRDVKDVVNYVKAMETAIAELERLPICSRLLKKAHAVLLAGTRGEEKNPGEYRHSQNWIGHSQSTIATARYVPPNPDDMQEAISDLEKYINADDGVEPLIKAALIHYQFETIHPFLDGNGRIGRLLIILYLMEQKVLTRPALYISYYLKLNRVEYYDRMEAVRLTGSYEQWVKFFLRAVIETASNAIKTIDELSLLHVQDFDTVKGFGRGSVSAEKVLRYAEVHPIFEIKNALLSTGLSDNTVRGAVRRLMNAGILTGSDDSRSRIYQYKAYLDVLRQGTENY